MSEHDQEVLYFIWRWKLATTSMLATRFYQATGPTAAYFRLWRLERAGFLNSICTPDGRNYFWTLTPVSFEIVKNHLPPLVETGFLSENLLHDLLVAAVQLGNGLVHHLPGISMWTEQELRRVDQDCAPSWVPKTYGRRPDGFWCVGNGKAKRIIGLEVEISQKKLERYRTIAFSYSLCDQCSQVIWVVSKPQLANAIHKQLIDRLPQSHVRHSLVHLSDFLTHHWQARVAIGGDVDKSIAELLGISRESGRNHVSNLSFFDTRKKPVNSTFRPNLKFFNLAD